MLGLRDVVFISPPHSLHQQTQPTSSYHHPNLSLPSAPALGVGVSIFPLLTATPCITQPTISGIEASNNNNTSGQLQESGDGGDGKRGSSMRACTDCGNRAKKDCGYKRCRTCCKSKGYDCVTHTKSTWIPAAHRRERKVVSGGGGGSSSSSTFGAKKSRVVAASSSSQKANTASHASASNATTPKGFESSPFHQDASFKESLPGQVRATAAFRCIRVTTISDSEAEFAYQATVNVCGHVFKGFLYDQGVDEKNQFPCISELHLESSTSGKNRGSSSPIVDPSDAFAASGSGKLLRDSS